MPEVVETSMCRWCKDLRYGDRCNPAIALVTTNSPSPITAPVCADHMWPDDTVLKTYNPTHRTIGDVS